MSVRERKICISQGRTRQINTILDLELMTPSPVPKRLKTSPIIQKKQKVEAAAAAVISEAKIPEPASDVEDGEITNELLSPEKTTVPATEALPVIISEQEYKRLLEEAEINPKSWTVEHVATFLELNGLQSCAVSLAKFEIDGAKLLKMNKETLALKIEVRLALVVIRLITKLRSLDTAYAKKHRPPEPISFAAMPPEGMRIQKRKLPESPNEWEKEYDSRRIQQNNFNSNAGICQEVVASADEDEDWGEPTNTQDRKPAQISPETKNSTSNDNDWGSNTTPSIGEPYRSYTTDRSFEHRGRGRGRGFENRGRGGFSNRGGNYDRRGRGGGLGSQQGEWSTHNCSFEGNRFTNNTRTDNPPAVAEDDWEQKAESMNTSTVDVTQKKAPTLNVSTLEVADDDWGEPSTNTHNEKPVRTSPESKNSTSEDNDWGSSTPSMDKPYRSNTTNRSFEHRGGGRGFGNRGWGGFNNNRGGNFGRRGRGFGSQQGEWNNRDRSSGDTGFSNNTGTNNATAATDDDFDWGAVSETTSKADVTQKTAPTLNVSTPAPANDDWGEPSANTQNKKPVRTSPESKNSTSEDNDWGSSIPSMDKPYRSNTTNRSFEHRGGGRGFGNRGWGGFNNNRGGNFGRRGRGFGSQQGECNNRDRSSGDTGFPNNTGTNNAPAGADDDFDWGAENETTCKADVTQKKAPILNVSIPKAADDDWGDTSTNTQNKKPVRNPSESKNSTSEDNDWGSSTPSMDKPYRSNTSNRSFEHRGGGRGFGNRGWGGFNNNNRGGNFGRRGGGFGSQQGEWSTRDRSSGAKEFPNNTGTDNAPAIADDDFDWGAESGTMTKANVGPKRAPIPSMSTRTDAEDDWGEPSTNTQSKMPVRTLPESKNSTAEDDWGSNTSSMHKPYRSNTPNRSFEHSGGAYGFGDRRRGDFNNNRGDKYDRRGRGFGSQQGELSINGRGSGANRFPNNSKIDNGPAVAGDDFDWGAESETMTKANVGPKKTPMPSKLTPTDAEDDWGELSTINQNK